MSVNPIVALSAPCLLVAMPHLSGSPFGQAVVLLARHSEEGSMGLMLNKPCGITHKSFVSGLGLQLAASGDGDQEVHVGGPVDTARAFIVHGGPHKGPETEALMPGLALSFSMESLTTLCEHPPSHLRICIGYAGWGQGQLAQEIARCDWLVVAADATFIFTTPPHALWHKTLRLMGIEPLQLGPRVQTLN